LEGISSRRRFSNLKIRLLADLLFMGVVNHLLWKRRREFLVPDWTQPTVDVNVPMLEGGSMNAEKERLTFKTSFCERYEELLVLAQEAMEIWSKRQEEVVRLGLHGKEVGSELIRLQANFAKSYAHLQKHIRACALCELVSKLAKENAPSPYAGKVDTFTSA
jgi:hypothetical protein